MSPSCHQQRRIEVSRDQPPLRLNVRPFSAASVSLPLRRTRTECVSLSLRLSSRHWRSSNPPTSRSATPPLAFTVQAHHAASVPRPAPPSTLSRGATLPPEVGLSVAASLAPSLPPSHRIMRCRLIYELAAGAAVANRGTLSTVG